MSDVYRQHRHNRSVGWSTWHLQWCTKYRYKVFDTFTNKYLCTMFLNEAAKRHNIDVLDCEVDTNHVHAIVSLPLTMTPVEAIGKLKGFTSKLLFIGCPDLKKRYPNGHIWSPGKFIGSIGHITLEKAKKYLEAHHAKTLNRNPRSGAKRRSRPKGEPLGRGGCQLFLIGRKLTSHHLTTC